MAEVIALLVSDIHLSERPPIVRAEEPDWYAAMARSLTELRNLAEEYGVPIINGGDVVDRWKSSPSLINFAINHLPEMYSVAGQHDLPNHRFEDIEKSAYWTLLECGNINQLAACGTYDLSTSLNVLGHSWGMEIVPPLAEDKDKGKIDLLVAHKYVWYGEAKYPGVSPDQSVVSCKDMFRGYDVALLGDNHKSWKAEIGIGGCLVYNPGSFFRRRSDEQDHRPQVGLLKDDKSIEIHYLDVSQDIFEVSSPARLQDKVGIQMDEFLEGLKGLGEEGLDFVEAVKAFLDREGVGTSIRQIIMKAMEG